jgi:hypothetical protein
MHFGRRFRAFQSRDRGERSYNTSANPRFR